MRTKGRRSSLVGFTLSPEPSRKIIPKVFLYCSDFELRGVRYRRDLTVRGGMRDVRGWHMAGVTRSSVFRPL